MVSLFPHPVSFRFRLTTDTLAFGYLLPATGRIRVFHPLESCAAGRAQTGVVSLKRGNSFLVQKSIRTMKIRMLAVECNYHENKLASDRLYSNDEWISADHAAGLRSKHREGCTGETTQPRHGKDGLTPPYPDVKDKGCKQPSFAALDIRLRRRYGRETAASVRPLPPQTSFCCLHPRRTFTQNSG